MIVGWYCTEHDIGESIIESYEVNYHAARLPTDWVWMASPSDSKYVIFTDVRDHDV